MRLRVRIEQYAASGTEKLRGWLSWRPLLALVYMLVVAGVFVQTIREFIHYTDENRIRREVTIPKTRVYSKDCVPSETGNSALRMDIEHEGRDNFVANLEYYLWDDDFRKKAQSRKDVFLVREGILRPRDAKSKIPLTLWFEPRGEKLVRVPYAYELEKKAAMIYPTANYFRRPLDSYLGGLSVLAVAADDSYSARPVSSPIGFPSIVLPKPRPRVVLPLDHLIVQPPQGFVVRAVNPNELGPFKVNENVFRENVGCDAFLFVLERQHAEIWFALFLLTVSILPVVLVLIGTQSHGLDLLGTVVTLGAIRGVVVGYERIPFLIDILLGAVLLVVVCFLVWRAARETRGARR